LEDELKAKQLTKILFMKKILILAFYCLIPLLSFSQTDTTKTKSEETDFDSFGDADDKKVKTYCTQKVNYLSPMKLISIGYEAQLDYHLSSTSVNNKAINTTATHVNSFGGLRVGLNTPIISKSNFILNLGLTFWNTQASVQNPERSPFFQRINSMNSTGLNLTAFKPLNDKQFLILQVNTDLNGNYGNLDGQISKALTYSGTAIYGWKKNDNFMWGLGITRTYRAGQLLHIPVVLYNRTFNAKWGIESTFPAKLNVRRNFSPTSYLMMGYEIEGNTFYLGQINASDVFLRRGELKPRITFETKLTGFVWLSAQAGLRYNWRFDTYNTKNPVANEKAVFSNTLGNPLYFNVSLNFVSP
jgi:hypothetical protein